MRLHVPALPGRPTTRANSSCAYTQKVRRFCEMMAERGHEVFLYGRGESDARGVTYIECYPESEVLAFDAGLWEPANISAAVAIAENKQPKDILCVIGGVVQEAVTQGNEDLLTVEYGIGYSGVFARFRVFESYAWMHTVYGHLAQNPMADEGRFFDAVIPNFFETEDFPAGTGEGDYLLYVGRLIERKGVGVAAEAARKAGVRLLIAGEGDYEPSYGEELGPVGPEQRAELMANARALICPTLYIEPFGGVAAEAMLCGTPVISTDWGAFTETVQQGVTGYRCRTLGEFCQAIEVAGELDRERTRAYATTNFSTEAIAPRYETFFAQLDTLYDEGWYSDWQGLESPRGILAP